MTRTEIDSNLKTSGILMHKQGTVDALLATTLVGDQL